MIWDLPKVTLYSRYKLLQGPFVIVFYEEEKLNKALYFKMRKMANKYKELPILRFHWREFKNRYPNEIDSYNKILIIEKGESNPCKIPNNLKKIEFIFKNLSEKRLEYKIQTNKHYKNNIKKRLEFFHPKIYKCADKQKPFIDNDESEYKFPNSTAAYPSEKYLVSKKKEYLKRTIIFLNKKINSYKKLLADNEEKKTYREKWKYEKKLERRNEAIERFKEKITKLRKELNTPTENNNIQKRAGTFNIPKLSLENKSPLKSRKYTFDTDLMKKNSIESTKNKKYSETSTLKYKKAYNINKYAFLDKNSNIYNNELISPIKLEPNESGQILNNNQVFKNANSTNSIQNYIAKNMNYKFINVNKIVINDSKNILNQIEIKKEPTDCFLPPKSIKTEQSTFSLNEGNNEIKNQNESCILTKKPSLRSNYIQSPERSVFEYDGYLFEVPDSNLFEINK